MPDLTEITRYDLDDGLTSQFVKCSSIVAPSEQIVRCCSCSSDIGDVIAQERLPPRIRFTAPLVTKFRKIHVGTALEVLHVAVESRRKRSDLLQCRSHRTRSCTFTKESRNLLDDESLDSCRKTHGFSHHRIIKIFKLIGSHFTQLGNHADITKKIRRALLDLLEDHLPGISHEICHHRTVFLGTRLLDVVRRSGLHHIRKSSILDYSLEVIFVYNGRSSE